MSTTNNTPTEQSPREQAIARIRDSWDYWSEYVGEDSLESDKAILAQAIMDGSAYVRRDVQTGPSFGAHQERGAYWLFRRQDDARMVAPVNGRIQWETGA